MRILRVHNSYQQRGGEDAVFEAETTLLRERGHDVSTWEVTNDTISESDSLSTKASLAVGTVWSRRSRAEAAARLEWRPDVVHVDNWFPQLSPSIYGPARERGIAVVQTLHNYRLLCPSATTYRDGHLCVDCVGRAVPWPGVVHACYRGSRLQTGVVAATIVGHRIRRTWHREVDRFVTLTEFERRLFADNGLPAERLVVKPNFVPDPGLSDGPRSGAFLFLGRLSSEKGVRTLLQAHAGSGLEVRVAGTGPLQPEVDRAASDHPRLVALGHLDRSAAVAELGRAAALIFPSEWYETFGLAMVEAFACRTPVIASRLGAMAEIVEDGRTGILFEPGSADDLAAKMRWAADHPEAMRRMGHNARDVYEARFTPDRNHDLLVDIYEQACQEARVRRP